MPSRVNAANPDLKATQDLKANPGLRANPDLKANLDLKANRLPRLLPQEPYSRSTHRLTVARVLESLTMAPRHCAKRAVPMGFALWGVTES